MKNNPFTKLLHITQFGLTLIGSVLICVFASLWIKRTFDTGYWVVALGIILGALSMFNSFYNLYRRYNKEDNDNKPPPGSNNHL